MFKPKVNKFVPPDSQVAPLPKAHIATVSPRIMPTPGQKHEGPNPNRWAKLQAYLEKPALPNATPKTEGDEPV